MIKSLLAILFMLILSACQVKEDVASSSQMGSPNLVNPQFTVIVPDNGWKKFGDALTISLVFPHAIEVSGMPYINVMIGTTLRKFYYNSGSGNEVITFRYLVTGSDIDADGIIIGQIINLNGGALNFTNNSGAIANAPTTISIPANYIQVDGSTPYILSVVPPTSGSYVTGQMLTYVLTYSEAVYVTGDLTFYVGLNSGTVPVHYHSGSGSTQLTFKRQILSGDLDTNGFSSTTYLNQDIYNDLIIVDRAGNLISPIIPTTTSPNIIINVPGPTIASLSTPAAATYPAGSNLNFNVTFSEAVKVTGIPAILLKLTTGNVLARYISGTDTTTLTFRHTVLANEQDLNGIELFPTLQPNGGTIKNMAQTIDAGFVFTPPATTTVLVDAVAGASIAYSFLPANGNYSVGQNLDFTISFNRPLTVTGVPQLTINLGAGTVAADYQPLLSTPTTLVFRYTTILGDNDSDGITIASPLTLNGGSIVDANSLAANLYFNTPDATGITIDTTPPFIASITPPVNGTYIPGSEMNVVLNLNEKSTVIGTPQVQLTIGSSTVYATYLSGSGTQALTFKYQIASGDLDADGIDVVSPLDINGGSINDLKNQSMIDFTFTAPATPLVKVDAVGPSILAITPPADASYKIGDNIDFAISWSEPVSFSGTPRLVLNVGGTTLYATYVPVGGGSPSTTTSSVFRYKVLAGQVDSDGITVGAAIDLAGGSVKDLSSNAATLSYTTPSLAAVLVDGIVPTISAVTPPTNGSYKTSQNLDFTVSWPEAVTITGSPLIRLVVGPLTINAVYYAAGSTSTNTVFRYNVSVGDLDTNGIVLNPTIYLNSGTIKDSVGNDALLTFTAPVTNLILVDGVAPTVASVTAPPNDTYKYGDFVDFKMNWNENIIITGAPRVVVSLDGVSVYAYYNAAASNSTQTIFRYTVSNGESDANGIGVRPDYPASPQIDLNSGTIKDIAGNDAILTYLRPNLTAVLVDGLRPVITSVTRAANGTYSTGAILNFVLVFSENVDIVGNPRIPLTVGTTTIYANYFSGTGTNSITFRYVVSAGQEDMDGITIQSPLDLNSGSIEDITNNAAYLTFSASGTVPIIIDAKSPVIQNVSTPQVGYKSGQIMLYNVTYSEPVFVSGGVPSIALNINGSTRNATYYQGSGSSTIVFRYQIDAGNTLLDLDGISVASTIALNGATMRDSSNLAAGLTFTFTEKDYIHFSNTLARYHFADNDYTVSNCGVNSCINTVNDISGTGNNILTSSMTGPVLGSGFGTNATSFAQFNNSAFLNMPNLSGVRYMIIVMKSNVTASVFWSASLYTVLGNSIGTRYYAQQSSMFGHVHQFQNATSMKQNNSSLTAASTGQASPYWDEDTDYIYQFQTAADQTYTMDNMPRLGDITFDGQIAEIILLGSGSGLTQAQIDLMQTQLNTIHGVY